MAKARCAILTNLTEEQWLVVRAVACRTREPGLYLSSFLVILLSSGIGWQGKNKELVDLKLFCVSQIRQKCISH